MASRFEVLLKNTTPSAPAQPVPEQSTQVDKTTKPQTDKATNTQTNKSPNQLIDKTTSTQIDKYTTHLRPDTVKAIKLLAVNRDCHDYDVVQEALDEYLKRNK